MKTLVAALGLVLAALHSTALADDTVSKETLVGTWENTAKNIPDGFRQVKHVTPTHFTWILYNRNDQTSLAMAGGTWSLKDGVYTEKIEFTDEPQKRFRGKEFVFDARMVDGKWHSKSRPNPDIDVDEVWRRAE